ncbi:MAG: tetratricopeptide repeat protein [Thermoanaerobaculaceae bacterium]|nr:tetratricopeptide repeat protein [Thermoanaerobaculaceae bacterium]
MTVGRGGAVAALLVAAWGVAEVPMPPEREAWFEVQTPGFVVVSNSRASRVEGLAADLDRMVETVGRVVPSSRGRSSRALVFLFDSRADFLRYCRPLAGSPCDGMAGLFSKRILGPLILADATNLDSARSIAYHELTHGLVRSSSPDIPLWLEEGLAELYSSFQVAGENVRIGHPLVRHIETVRQRGLLPLGRLLSIDIDSEEYSSDTERPRFYATSWLLTHYLIVGSPARQGQLARFTAEVRRGQPVGAAFQAAFNCEPPTMEKELARYAGAAQMPVLQLKVDEVAPASTPRPRTLARDEVLAHLATIYIDRSEDGSTDASRLLFEALRLNPGSVRAMTLRAWALAQLGSAGDATALFEEALRLTPADPDALVLYARSLLERLAPTRSPGAMPVAAAELARPRELLDQALRVAPEHVLGLVTLGRSYVVSSDRECGPGIAHLSRALELDPGAVEAAFFLAQLLARTGAPERAEAVIDRYFANSSSPAERAQARALRADLAVFQARRLDAEGKHQDAIRMLEQTLAATREIGPRESVRGELDRLRQAERVRSLTARIDVMSTAAALAACDEVLGTLTDPALRAQVETLRTWLRSSASGTQLAPRDPPPSRAPSAPQPPPAEVDRADATRPRSLSREAREEVQRLNQAVALSDRGDVEGALRIADDLAGHATNKVIQEAAADFAARLRSGQIRRSPTPAR